MAFSMLARLERPVTLKEATLRKLREAIILGELQPGNRLVERVLCAQLGVSRTVVRECIRHLESERMVTSVPNAGPSVAQIDSCEIQQIYEVRGLLEAAAIRSCAEVADESLGQQLHVYCDSIAKALEQNEILQALQFTTGFYREIFTRGDKLVSWDLVEHLNARIGWLRALTLSATDRRRVGPERLREIASHIQSGDADKAVAACEKHLQGARDTALAELRKRNEAKDP